MIYKKTLLIIAGCLGMVQTYIYGAATHGIERKSPQATIKKISWDEQTIKSLKILLNDNDANSILAFLKAHKNLPLTETKNDQGDMVIHIAIQEKNKPLTSYLLRETSINPNVKNGSGKTPLHLAAEAGYGDGVKLLLGSPRTSSITKDSEGNTPLHLAVTAKAITNEEKQRYNEVIDLLLDAHDANVDIKNNNDVTVLKAAKPSFRLIIEKRQAALEGGRLAASVK